MDIRRVALIYDDKLRPETTGVYCRRALQQLVEVSHYRPADLATMPRQGFDLYLNIDDGLDYQLPANLQQTALWGIDTHLQFERLQGKAAKFDHVFAAQRDGAARLQDAIRKPVLWLPLACDSDLHGRQEVDKRFDVAFIGNLIPGARAELLEVVCQRFSNTFVGRAFFKEMARTYSQAKIVFNRSVCNDVNMRVFEALASGSMLLTNELRENGQAELFHDGVHLATYCEVDDLLEKIDWYLRHDEERERIAAAGRAEVLARHTYRHRMQTLLEAVAASARPTQRRAAAQLGKPRNYYEFPRPEVVALIPTDARRVLDIGCGAGALGAALKQRQTAEVVGVEMDVGAAAVAETRLDEVVVGSIESLNFAAGSFDCVVCADVLEHLRHPEQVLAKIRGWLRPGGSLVASVPNVQHHTVVRSLLEGNWTYETAGLLDETHLHFFTRQDFERLLSETGFALRDLQMVPGSGFAEWVQQGRPGKLPFGSLVLSGLTPAQVEAFLAYQYLVTATPQSIAAPTSLNAAVPAESTNGLGCVMAVRNRPARYLERAFQTYAYQSLQPVDKLLLDYGSDLAFATAYQRVCAEYGWRYLRAEPVEPRWRLSAAYNLAIASLNPQVTTVFKSDVDVLLGENVLETANRIGQERFCQFQYITTPESITYPVALRSHADLMSVYAQHNKQVPSAGQGLFACPLAWFRQIGGFDLEFATWGFEDHDLHDRAALSIGVTEISFRDALLLHQWHAPSSEAGEAAENRAYFERMHETGVVVRNNGRPTGAAPATNPPSSKAPADLSRSVLPVRATGVQAKRGDASLTVRIIRNYDFPDLLRQTPGGTGRWGDVLFTENEDAECDYAVVLNEWGRTSPASLGIPTERTWAVIQEPPVGPFQDYHHQRNGFGRVYTSLEDLPSSLHRCCPGALPWHVNRDYNTLARMRVPEKRHDLSCITSNKQVLPGHVARLQFLQTLSSQMKFDLFGRGFRDLPDKWDGLAPYRYSLAIENFRGGHYWTEKIADSFLAWTMPIYCGSPRIAEYFPPESFIEIDIDEPEEALERIRDAIAGDRAERNRDAIAHARELVLKRYQLFPFLAGEIAACEAARRASIRKSRAANPMSLAINPG